MQMLEELIQSGFGNDEDYNCAEKILYGANKAYNMGLSYEDLKLSAGFGGGAAVGELCGALCGAIMVLSHYCVDDVAHKSPELKPAIQELLADYEAEMGSIRCTELKEKYRTPEKKCFVVIDTAARLLDKQIAKLETNRQKS